MVSTFGTAAKLKLCRRCGLDETQTRFSQLGRTLCHACKPARAARVTHRARADRRSGECPEHLAWIRTIRCLVATRGVPGRTRCGTLTHAHHVRSATGGGTGLKPGDRWVVPLCPVHHLELHNHGAQTFERRHGLNLRAAAEELAALSPYLTELSCDQLPF